MDDENGVSHDIAEKIRQDKEVDLLFEPKEEVSRSPQSDRTFYIVLACIVGALLVLFVGYRLVFPPEKAYSLDELHSLNLAGKLSHEKGYIYGGYSFVRLNDRWFTRLGGAGGAATYDVELRFGPEEVKNVSLSGQYLAFILNNTQNATYVSFDPLAENLSFVALSSADISTALNKVFRISAFPACTKNETGACQNLPVVSCIDGPPVIVVQDSSVPRVWSDGVCMVVEGRNMDIVRAADRLLLAWYGIMA